MTQEQALKRNWDFRRLAGIQSLAYNLQDNQKLYKLSKQNTSTLLKVINDLIKEFNLQSKNYRMCDECSEKISKNGRFKKNEYYVGRCEVCGKLESTYYRHPKRRLTLQEAREHIKTEFNE